jgi:hypothetical protein
VQWHREEERKRRERDETEAIAKGYVRMAGTHAGTAFAPAYFAALADAEARRDRQIASKTFVFKPTPADFWWPDRAVEDYLHLWLERYVDGAWQMIAGSDRECLVSVRPNAEAEAMIRRQQRRRR